MIGDALNNPAAPIVIGSMLGMAGLALAIVVRKHQRRRFLATHGPAFHTLCEGLGIGRMDRWRLQRLADRAGLLTPAVLLISRGAFDDALRRADVQLDARWPQSFRARVFDPSELQSSSSMHA